MRENFGKNNLEKKLKMSTYMKVTTDKWIGNPIMIKSNEWLGISFNNYNEDI